MPDYHSNKEYVSRSMLMDLKESPEYFHHIHLSGLNEESSTKAMKFGSALHTYVLEPEEFRSRYVTLENKFDRRTKKGKEDYENFITEAGDRIVLNLDEYKNILSISNQIKANYKASLLLGGAICEEELYWVDPETGVKCKCKPDARNLTEVADLKSADDISQRGIRKATFKYGYHIQAAMIREGMRANKMGEMSSFWIIAADKKPPFSIGTYMLEEDLIEYGLYEFRKLIGTYKECLEKDNWPGPQPGEISLRNKLEQELKMEYTENKELSTHINDMRYMSIAINSSNFCPKEYRGKPFDIFIAILMGKDVGLKPLQAVKNISPLHGRPTLWGDVLLAIVKSSGLLEYCKEWQEDDTAYCEVKRKGESIPTRCSFSLEDAKKANLTGKSTWLQYTNRMLKMRARSFALRDSFPDFLCGLEIREEVMDHNKDNGIKSDHLLSQLKQEVSKDTSNKGDDLLSQLEHSYQVS